MARILVISFSDLGRDARLDRQIDFLRAGHEVVAAGLGPPRRGDVEFVDLRPPARSQVRRQAGRAASAARLLARRWDAAYWGLPVQRGAAERLSGVRADLVLANDVETLPLARRIAGSAPVVFDAHEWALGQYEHVRWWPLLMRPQVDALLREHLPHVAAMTTVGPGIAELYEERYGIKPRVVTNAAPRAELRPTPVHDPIRLLHHGGTQPQRRIELMIEAVRMIDARVTLDLMLVPGDERYRARLEAAAAGDERIRFRPAVQMQELVAAANDYDAGIVFFPPDQANLELVLPNKLFECLQARLAVVMGPSVEMVPIVNEFGCGVVTSSFSAEALAEALRDLTPERLSELKAGADRAAAVHCAERNQDAVLELVDEALAARQSPLPDRV